MYKRLLAGIFAVAAISPALAEDYEAVRAAMKSLAPDIQIDSISPAPFSGFVEVLLGAQLVYVSEDGEYLIDGQLIEVESRKNLSEKAKGRVRVDKLAEVTDAQRIVFPANGETRHSITIFTDIDCGYCRKLHNEMAQYNDLGIEVNYLFFPRAGMGSNSFDKAISVWCADDRNLALTDAKNGQDPEPQTCENPIESHFELGKDLGVTGTPALIAEDGTMLPGYVPPATLISRLDVLSQSSQ